MIIVFCIDKNYIDLARVSLASYRKQNPQATLVCVTEDPIEDIGFDEYMQIKPKRDFRTRGPGDRITRTAYLKLYLPLLPYDKIIYVDADTICKKPLDKLWNMQCKYINLCETYSIGKKMAKAIGAKKYGLSGMMVMNLKKLREINFIPECLFVEKECPVPETGWQHDETVINVTMRDRLRFISKKWNYCTNRKYDDPIPEKDAHILHYVGCEKIKMLKGVRYSSMWPLAKHIYGKRIAIVGNAQSIFEKENGHEIDNQDFVIRFNKGFIEKPISQGSRTDLLLLALTLEPEQIKQFKAKFVANRSRFYHNKTDLMIPDRERGRIAEFLGAQPSSGFIAIEMCLYFGAKEINLYGFDFEKTKTFYNPDDYKTQHKYKNEEKIVRQYEKEGFLKIN